MSRCARLGVLFCCFICGVFPAFAGPAEWVEVRSPHFSVVTDAGEKRGKEAALHFEQMRGAFGALMDTAKVSLPVPLQIVAFRNTKEMRDFVPLWHGKPVDLAGLFQGGDDRCFILLDMSVEDPWHVVFHEYAHQLMNGNIPVRMQPWFEEGFAEYFSTVEANGKTANVGKPPEVSYTVLRQNRLMKTADLFRVQQNSSTYNESGDHRSVFYAQSWLVVHYIYDHKLIPNVAKYYEFNENRGLSAEDSIQQAFGMSAADFDKALEHYLSANAFLYYRVPMPPGLDSSSYTTRRLSDLDARAVMADTHLHSPEHRQQAADEFAEILKQQPNNATALRGLGYSYLMQHDLEHAGETLSKAAEIDPNDARVLYYSAVLAQREGWNEAQLPKVQQQLEKSISLDPDFADAYHVLALVYLSEGKQQPAIDSMRKAVQLNPRREDYSLNLAHVYLAGGKYDEGIRLLTELSQRKDSWIATVASRELASAKNAKEGEANAKALLQQSGASAGSQPGDGSAGTVVVVSEAASAPVPVKFLKGKLLAVDCSSPPAAVLNVISENKTWKFRARDIKHMIVIGADELSCSAVNQAVAINFRETGDGTGDLVSLEIQ